MGNYFIFIGNIIKAFICRIGLIIFPYGILKMKSYEYILIGGEDHGFIFDERNDSRPLDGSVIFWRKNNIQSDIYCYYNRSIYIYSPQFSYAHLDPTVIRWLINEIV